MSSFCVTTCICTLTPKQITHTNTYNIEGHFEFSQVSLFLPLVPCVCVAPVQGLFFVYLHFTK